MRGLFGGDHFCEGFPGVRAGAFLCNATSVIVVADMVAVECVDNGGPVFWRFSVLGLYDPKRPNWSETSYSLVTSFIDQ